MTVESVSRLFAHPRSRNESMANYMLVKGFMEKRAQRLAGDAQGNARVQ